MKKLLLIFLCVPFIGFGQACQYGSSADASELCDFYQSRGFATYRNADIALDKILDVTGMAKRFVLKECNDISNCLATTYKGIRYILYDRDFMDAIATRTNSWSSISILAHEIGHHVNGHTLGGETTLSESRQMEIEADEYSGFVMFKLGASLSQAQEAIRVYGSDKDDSYSTHPSRNKRLRAIERGYNKAKGQGSNNSIYTESNSELSRTSNSHIVTIDFESKVVDYGVIEHKSDGVRKFVFTNNGTEPLAIYHVKSSCGCAVPTYPRDVIATGETGEIGVKYATNRIGKFTKTITLTTNASKKPIILTIKGDVRPPMRR